MASEISNRPEGALLVLQEMVETAVTAADDKVKQIEQVANKQLALAEAYVIDSAEMMDVAAGDLRTIEAMKKRADARRLDITRPLDSAKSSIKARFDAPIATLDRASAILRRGILSFQQAERAKHEQARLEAEEAERVRIAELEKQAAKAKSAAKREAIQDQIEQAQAAPPLPAVVEPKAEGISGRKRWVASEVDLKQLVLGVAARLQEGDDSLLIYLQANDAQIGQSVRALKAATRIPGVRVEEVESLAVRS